MLSDEEKKRKKRETDRKSYAKNREKRAKQAREWRKKNHERYRKTQNEWYAKNRVEWNKYQRERNKKIAPKINKQRRENYAKNRPKIRAYQKIRYDKNPEKFRKEAKIRMQKSKPERLARKKRVFSIYSKRLSNSKIPCCACCGENFSHEFLVIDHISGRKIHGHKPGFGGDALYRWLQKNNYPDGFQVLCHNCNSAKGEFGKCPHEK